jgi:hypothetical protein
MLAASWPNVARDWWAAYWTVRIGQTVVYRHLEWSDSYNIVVTPLLQKLVQKTEMCSCNSMVRTDDALWTGQPSCTYLSRWAVAWSSLAIWRCCRRGVVLFHIRERHIQKMPRSSVQQGSPLSRRLAENWAPGIGSLWPGEAYLIALAVSLGP